jgi:putative effector of murein hydrolase
MNFAQMIAFLIWTLCGFTIVLYAYQKNKFKVNDPLLIAWILAALLLCWILKLLG